jgi:hypothetical protein
MRSGKEGIALAALAGVTLLVGGIEAARADTTTPETESFDIGTVNADVNSSTNLTFDKFNPALGTLTGAKFTLESSTDTTAYVEVNAAEESFGEGSTDNSSSFEVQVNTPVVGTLFGPIEPSATAFCSTEESSSCEDSQSDPQSFDGTFTVPINGGNIGDFVGPGTFDAELLYSAFLETGCENAECFHDGTISWSGTLSVEYTYDPVAVPEPGTLALFGVGLAGAAAARRRRKRD